MDRISSSTTLKYDIRSTSSSRRVRRHRRQQLFVFCLVLVVLCSSNTCHGDESFQYHNNNNNNESENDIHYNLATTGIRNQFFDTNNDSLEVGSSLTRSNNNQQLLLRRRRRQTFEVVGENNEHNNNNIVVVKEAVVEEPLRFAFLDNELLVDSQDESKNNESRIIDGTEIPNDRYLYLVALFKKDTKGYLTHMCGGAIISPNYVLTAAHCLANTNVVVTGLKDYRNVMPGTYERYDVTQDDFIPHPDYSSSTLNCDFALIKLNQRTRFPRLQLNFSDFIPQGKQIMTVMGWGYLRNNNASSMANEAVLENVDMITCRAKWGVSTIKDSMMCATGYGKVDTCQGDSGGPMIIKGSSDGEDRLTGLTSWGAGCADATYPGVYARVSYTKEWIQSIIPELFDSNGTPIVPQEETSTSSTTTSINNTGGTTTTDSTTTNTSPGSTSPSGTTSTDSTSSGTSTPPAENGCVIETQCVTILFVYNWCQDVCV